MTAEYVLELGNVFHSGQVVCDNDNDDYGNNDDDNNVQVEPGTCLQKLVGSVRTGVILKDVSLEVHGGELTAILGSKGKVTHLTPRDIYLTTTHAASCRYIGKIKFNYLYAVF